MMIGGAARAYSRSLTARLVWCTVGSGATGAGIHVARLQPNVAGVRAAHWLTGRGVALRDTCEGGWPYKAQAAVLRERLALARSVLETRDGFGIEPEILVPKWASDRDVAGLLPEWRGKRPGLGIR